MNYSIFRFTLNMHNHRSQASVPVFRGDTAVRLMITITDGGNPYYIEDGCIAVLNGTKADGKKLCNRCEIESQNTIDNKATFEHNCVIQNNNTIIYDFTEQTSCCAGVVNCEIVIYGADGKAITAPKFVIVVDEREVGYKDVVESVSEANVLDNIISSENARLDAEKTRVAQEETRGIAESSRIKSETARAEAETARVKAEAGREGRLTALAEDIEFLKLVNEGHTFAFRTDSETASAKHIPSNALPTVVLEKVCGKTVTAVDFSMAVPELIPFALESITIRGKNLLPSTVYDIGKWETLTESGYRVFYLTFLKEGTYTITAKTIDGKALGSTLNLRRSLDGGASWTTSQICEAGTNGKDGYLLTTTIGSACKTFNVAADTMFRLIYVGNDANFARIGEIQIEHGNESTEYTPYKEPITYTIPQEIKNLAGYGHGISDAVCNYIDFDKKQYVQMCAERDFKEEDRDNPSVIYNHIETLTIAPLNEPFVPDISEHLTFDNTFEVQGGGCVEFDFSAIGEIYGDYEELNPSIVQAPSTIHYQVKL